MMGRGWRLTLSKTIKMILIRQLMTSFKMTVRAVVRLLSCVQIFETPWTAACQASLSLIIYQNLFRLMSVESMMPYNDFILSCPFLLLPSIFFSIRIISQLTLHIRWPKYWSFSFCISPSNEFSGLICFRIDWFDLLAV